MFAQIITYTVKAGNEQEAIETVKQINALASKEEPGNLFFCAHTSQQEPRRIVLYEQWRDDEAIDEHRRKPYFQELIVGKLRNLVEGYSQERLDPF